MEDMKTLCCRFLEGHGGVSLAKSLLSGETDPGTSTVQTLWCKCKHCKPMPQPIENKCCGRTTCITQYEIFSILCLHPVVLRVAIKKTAVTG